MVLYFTLHCSTVFGPFSFFVFVGFIYSTGKEFILSNVIASGLSHFGIIGPSFFFSVPCYYTDGSLPTVNIDNLQACVIQDVNTFFFVYVYMYIC